MAELTKKLNIKKAGTTTACKIYSTTSEAGISYAKLKVDNVSAYIPLVATSDSRASQGRMRISGTDKAIATTGKPPYTEKSWTIAGTYTWTAPAGVTRIRAAVCGGGGGGNCSKIGTAGKGGDTVIKNNTIILMQATGGNGGYADSNDNYAAGNGGNPNGRQGTAGSRQEAQGGTGFALSFSLNNGTYGQGGGAQKDTFSVSMGGGSGGYNTGYIDVNANTTYSITVGAGGAKLSDKAYNGNSGFVLIAYGGDI